MKSQPHPSENKPSRKELKHAHQLVGHGRKLLRIHKDVLKADTLARGGESLDRLEQTVQKQEWARFPEAVKEAESAINTIQPPQTYRVWRENLEAIFVAFLIAGAIRTFFIQPFKIPTGSMQPTLYGNHDKTRFKATEQRPSFLVRLWEGIIWSKSYNEEGYEIGGDRIFVDRFTYNFIHPKRGDVVVFRTHQIKRQIELSSGKSAEGDFYIKRLVGFGGEKISIQNKKLFIDGNLVESPTVFKKIYESPDYSGYTNPSEAKYLSSPSEAHQIKKDGYFVFGDNTNNSLDSRYWGEFPKEALIGRAFLIYWPFSNRIGAIK